MTSRQVSRIHILLVVILCVIAFGLRAYAIPRDMFFGYDQGRDAQEMQKIASGDLTLIGPVTGLDGVFLGPFWYYLIFPAYLIGAGNPVYSGYEMVLFAVGTVVMLYLWGRKLGVPWAGLIAGALYTFSFQNILFSRWASNPTPLPFFALVSFFFLWNALERKQWRWWLATGVLFGLCIQLEAANAVWFLPTTALIICVDCLKQKQQRLRSFFKRSTVLVAGFALAESPHILFEIKHHFLITRNILVSLLQAKDITLSESLPKRIPLLYKLYAEGLFREHTIFLAPVLLLMLYLIWKYREKLRTRLGFWILGLWFCVPLFFHIIYTGNHGNFWDYYVISQHPALYLCIGVVLAFWYRESGHRRIVGTIITAFVLLSAVPNFLKWTEIIHPYEDRFSLEMIIGETNWMIDQSSGTPYGVWVYAPNAQDNPHRYVYSWIGKQRGVWPEEHVEQQPLIFLAVEEDPVFQKRHDEWIAEKMTFGSLLSKKKFGAITVYELENTFRGK